MSPRLTPDHYNALCVCVCVCVCVPIFYAIIPYVQGKRNKQTKKKRTQGKLVHGLLPVLLSCCPVLSSGMEAFRDDVGHLETARSVTLMMAGVRTQKANRFSIPQSTEDHLFLGETASRLLL